MTPDFNEKEGKHIQMNAIRKSCLLARCSIGDTVNKFLVDTGSVASILSKKVFMSLKNRPCLRDTDDILTAADGSTLRILGKADVQFSIDGICFCHEFTFAGIDDLKGIIGMDFLEQHDAMMRISKGLLHIAGTQIQILSKGVVVPPDSEIIVSGYADGCTQRSAYNRV